MNLLRRLRPALGHEGQSAAAESQTVTTTSSSWSRNSAADFDLAAETVERTTLGAARAGTRVNLERSLKVGDELGGHIVSGHVDGLGEIVSITPEGDSKRFRFRVPDELARFIAPKGSVAIDGTSLTVNEVEGNVFGVNIIPHTWENTSLKHRRPGDKVNIEYDLLVKAVQGVG